MYFLSHVLTSQLPAGAVCGGVGGIGTPHVFGTFCAKKYIMLGTTPVRRGEKVHIDTGVSMITGPRSGHGYHSFLDSRY